MPVRACIDANGSPAFRWGRKGKVFPYGHGIGITKTQAFDLAARHGRVTRLRQLQQEDWARGMKLDARSRGPFRGRVPLFSERAAQAHEQLLGSQLALTLRLLKQYGGADIKAAQADLTERRTDADPASYFRLLSVIRAIRATVGASAEGAAEGLRFIGEEVDEDATETTDKQLSRLFTIPLATAAGSQAAVDGFVATNIGLIKSLTGTALDEVEEMVVGAMTGGTPTLDLAKAIEERFGVAWSRASLIARDQTAKLASQIAQSQQEKYGIEKYMWSTSGGARVRQEHADLDGSIQKWAEPPIADKSGKRGHPGEVWQCLPGNAPIAFAERAVVAYRRRYSGELAEIVTDSGIAIRTTPNHPVLTTRGWMRAQDVQVGDHVVNARQHGAGLAKADIEHRQPTIEEVFDALSLVGTPKRARGGVVDFHGDGSDEDVDLVAVDWSLPDEFVAAFSQKGCELLLTHADATLPEARNLDQVFAALGLPSTREVRGFCKLLAVLDGCAGHPGDHAFGAVAWLDAAAAQLRADGGAGDAVALCERLHARAAGEQPRHLLGVELLRVVGRAVGTTVGGAVGAERLGEVVGAAAQDGHDLGEGVTLRGHAVRVSEVRRGVEPGGAHVFNLHTAPNWYVAGGIIVHNCRCTATPVFDDEDEAMLRAQAVARQQSELLTMQASPTVQGEIPNYSKFSDWNASRIAAIRRGDPASVGLPG